MTSAGKVSQAEGEKRRLEAVLRCMTKGVVIADPDGNVISINPAALKLFGIPSEEQARRQLTDFGEFELRTLDGAPAPFAEWPLARAARGETFTGYELEVRRLDTGTRFIGNFGAAPVRDEDGRVILLVQSVRDVTHQHEVERALRQSNSEHDFALQAGRMRVWRWEFSVCEGPRRELLLDAGFDIDRDQPLNGVLRRRAPDKIERNERQRCLIKNAGSWRLWSRSEPENRRNHSGGTTGPR